MVPVTPAAVPLRRNLRFQLLWVGSTIGFLGIEAADIGYPLTILALTGSPARAGLFGFVQSLAGVLLAVPAGQVVDRHDRRRVLLCAEGGRALAAASVAVALAAHHLTLTHLLVVAAILGAGSAFGGPARMLVVRAVVPSEQLTAALTQEEVREGTAVLVGPPLGGLLYAVRQALPFLFSAVTFTVSWLCVLVVRIPPRTGAAAQDEAGAAAPGGRFEGLRILLRDPVLRTSTLLIAVLNAVGVPLTLVAVVLLRDQGASPRAIGLAMAGLAIGTLAGTPLVRPLHRALRPGVLLIAFFLVETPILALLGVPLGPWWVGGLLILATVAMPALRVLIDVLIFRQVPDEVRGRVISAAILLFGIGSPVGVGVAGLLLEHLGPQGATLALAAVLALGGGYALSRRTIRAAQWPAES
ncbi:MAG TPA: MFS transporter [Micromonosporaceae bacterium]